MDDRVRRLLYLGLARASAGRIELVVSAQAMARALTQRQADRRKSAGRLRPDK